MNRLLIFSFLLIVMVSANARAQKLEAQPVTPEKWIKSWLLCGPIPLEKPAEESESYAHLQGFNTDYLVKFGGEQNLSVKAGDVVKFKKGSAKWKLYNSPDSIIDLNKAISKADPVLAYAYTEIQSEEDRIWFISFGTNDGGKLWVNGMNVWDFESARGLSADNDQVPVLLKKGKNTILFKIEQRGNRWEFCARFKTFSIDKLAANKSLFRITTDENGEAKVTSEYVSSVLDQLIRNVSIEVSNHQNKIVAKEDRNANFCGSLAIPSNDYQAYLGKLKILLKTGQTILQEYSFYAGKRKIYTLFADQKSSYRIAIDAQATESEKWAAKELQHWLKQAGGAELPIQDLSQPFSGPQIVIGYNELVKAQTGEPKPADLDESFRYFNSGANLFIYGGAMRGSMYGVMAFLENELGCRWYTPEVSVIPEKKTYSFDWLDHSEKPGVRVRNDFYFEAFNPEWAARNRMNGTLGFAESAKQPGGTENYWAVHTFYPLVPPEEFFGKHPEYYSLIDGKRTHDHAQLCLTNPDVLKIIVERIKKRMHDSPEYLIYDVSQNDWRNPCQCEKCQAIVQKEGSESGLIIWFVNQVAEAVEKEFPDKFIGTLAYQYTRTPPQYIRPRNNVVVRLCSIECCFAHDFKTCPENKSFLDDLQKWATLAPHLYIWDYVVNFSHYIMPYPNFNVLQSNIKTLIENNSIGIMEQAAYQSRGGEFSELRAYLISRLLWNPDVNTENAINDFMYGYYGRSGQLVRQYFDLLNSRVTTDTHIHLGLTPEDKLFTDEFINQSYQIFEEAKKVADNDEILHRVEMASLPIFYLKCKRMPVLSRFDGTYDAFCAITKREGITHYAEAGEPQRKAFHQSVETAK
jgi:hypothetical protein